MYILIKRLLDFGLALFILVLSAPVMLLTALCVACSCVIPLPALWANSANKFFDSLAAGKPIIINHQGWQATVIREKNLGYVLNHTPDSMHEEARLFSSYLDNAALIQEQGANASSEARASYSLEIAAGKYHTIFSHVL